MRKEIVVGKMLKCGLVVGLAMSVCAAAWGEQVPKLQRISDHVYACVGATDASPAANSYGANAGVVVGRDAVLVIDTLMSATHAQRLAEAIGQVTDKPVKYVVNTYYHVDHVLGNCVFVKQGAVVIGHENTRLDMPKVADRLAHPESLSMTPAELQGTVLAGPVLWFAKSMSIDLGDVTVELNYPGPTHTSGSITAYVPQEKVLFAGDILFTRYHPNIVEGDLGNWQQVLADLEKTPATKIIPGHGPLSSVSDLREMRAYLHEFDAQAKSLCAGKAAADAAAIADVLVQRLPEQNRTELRVMVERSLRARYLPREVGR
jgi:glyoxylase-like metal-dependent hydrolase (beta-lactamase superfamily II)